jgi:mannose-1-phosphate guanylyltransferase / mannose-6-phosphate isomerase
MKNLNKLIISQTDSIHSALKKIQENNKGFLIVTDKNNKVLGTLTDGDIRRQLITGMDVTDRIEIEIDFNFLKESNDFNVVCTMFKSEKINFLPIVDEQFKLVNVITKKQFHALILHDFSWDTRANFSSFDELSIEYEVHNRPWGYYKSTLLSDLVQSKIITVFSNEQLSLQEHKLREEHWIIVKGFGKVIIGESVLDIHPGKYIYIPKGCKHQIINDSDENIVFTEVQLGSYFGEDDILRYSDKYGRDLIPPSK